MHNFYKSQWAASNQNQLSENKVVKTIQNAHILTFNQTSSLVVPTRGTMTMQDPGSKNVVCIHILLYVL